MSNFDKVRMFHQVFGHPSATGLRADTLTSQAELHKFRLSLLQEEVGELGQAIQDRNLAEVADALGDILYVAYGYGHAIGLDLDRIFDRVHQNNMTKLCATEKQAQDSVKKYASQGLETCYRAAEGVPGYAVYNVKTGKLLKSCDWKPPVFDDIIQDCILNNEASATMSRLTAVVDDIAQDCIDKQ